MSPESVTLYRNSIDVVLPQCSQAFETVVVVLTGWCVLAGLFKVWNTFLLSVPELARVFVLAQLLFLIFAGLACGAGVCPRC